MFTAAANPPFAPPASTPRLNVEKSVFMLLWTLFSHATAAVVGDESGVGAGEGFDLISAGGVDATGGGGGGGGGDDDDAVAASTATSSATSSTSAAGVTSSIAGCVFASVVVVVVVVSFSFSFSFPLSSPREASPSSARLVSSISSAAVTSTTPTAAASHGLSASATTFPAFGSTSASTISLRNFLVISPLTVSPSSFHRIPYVPTAGAAAISTTGSSTNPNQTRSPGGGGIHTRSVPLNFKSRTVSVSGVFSNVFATAFTAVLAKFFNGVNESVVAAAAPDSAPDSAPPPPTDDDASPPPPPPPPSVSARRSTCVFSVISGAAPSPRAFALALALDASNATSSSTHEHGPRFASAPPSHGAAETSSAVAFAGTLAETICGVAFPSVTRSIRGGETNFGRSGTSARSASKSRRIFSSSSASRSASNNTRDSSALIVAPAAPPDDHASSRIASALAAAFILPASSEAPSSPSEALAAAAATKFASSRALDAPAASLTVALCARCFTSALCAGSVPPSLFIFIFISPPSPPFAATAAAAAAANTLRSIAPPRRFNSPAIATIHASFAGSDDAGLPSGWISANGWRLNQRFLAFPEVNTRSSAPSRSIVVAADAAAAAADVARLRSPFRRSVANVFSPFRGFSGGVGRSSADSGARRTSQPRCSSREAGARARASPSSSSPSAFSARRVASSSFAASASSLEGATRTYRTSSACAKSTTPTPKSILRGTRTRTRTRQRGGGDATRRATTTFRRARATGGPSWWESGKRRRRGRSEGRGARRTIERPGR
eukprot:30846-Pelagococcus_subviridis.AAC.1